MDDFVKEPNKATLYYREQSLRSMAMRHKNVAQCWRLAADAAKQAARQSYRSSILEVAKMPFVDHFTRLAMSLQTPDPAFESLFLNRRAHQESDEEVPQEIFFQYRYWLTYLTVSSSHHFEREMLQLTEAGKKYLSIFPAAAALIKQALQCFKKAQHYQQSPATTVLIQKDRLVSYWAGAAYAGAYAANAIVQQLVFVNEEKKIFLENWSRIIQAAEKAFLLRVQAAEACEKGEEGKGIEYSLAAFASSERAEWIVEMLKAAVADNHSMVLQIQAEMDLPCRILEMREALAATAPSSCFQRSAANWMETAWEADLKHISAVAEGYKQLSFYWREARDASKKMAQLFSEAAASPDLRWWHRARIQYCEKQTLKKIPTTLMEEVFFCMPENYFPSAALRKQWEEGRFISFLERNTSLTANTWLYQTGSLLQKAGVKCHFFTKMPSLPYRGIIITMSGFLYTYSKRLQLDPSLFLAGIVADEGIPHPAAMVHLIPNRLSIKRLPFAEFIPHWSQPFLIPRDPKREKRFETVCFMGYPQNIAPALCSQEWHQRLAKELGLRFIQRSVNEWHDFSDVDCIVAIRDFSKRVFCYKPAHKLYNAWLAGVPFIGGRDSAYVADGHPGKDYLVAHSAEEVFQYLKKLKEDQSFRAQIIESGSQSGAQFTREMILQQWKQCIQETLPIQALKWYRASSLTRYFLRLLQYWNCGIQSFIHQYYKPKKYTFVSGKERDLFTWANPPEKI